MSRIISIIKDRHLGDFEYNLGGKTVRCLRACDYRVWLQQRFKVSLPDFTTDSPTHSK